MGLSDKFAKLHKSPNKVAGKNDKGVKKTNPDSGKKGDKEKGDKKKGQEAKAGGKDKKKGKKNGKKLEKRKSFSEEELNNDMDAYWHKAGKGPDPKIKALDSDLEAMAAKKAEAAAKK